MGRNRKNKKRQRNDEEKHKKKRLGKVQKREQFWIEDCRDSSLPLSPSLNTTRTSLEVLITQCQLFDDYKQASEELIKPAIINDNTKVDKVTDSLGSSHSLFVESNDGTKINTVVKAPQKREGYRDDIYKKNPGQTENKIVAFSDAFICIKRAKSAMKPTKTLAHSVINFKPLPNGDCGDGISNPHNNKDVPDKFWSQRRRLFTLFDKGIQLDKESWYSVTPEAIANHISTSLVGRRENAIILDPFCGCGGNAIAFAKMERVKLVVCVDNDLGKLKMAASNATIYGIPSEKMSFIHCDAGRVLALYKDRNLVNKPVLSKLRGNKDKSSSFRIGGIELLPDTIDCIFLSPPWGGVHYANMGKRNYTLQCIRVDGTEEDTGMDGEDILNEAAKALGHGGPVAYFLPKNINGVALGRSVLRAGYSCPLVLEKNVLNGKLKTVTAYVGLSDG